MLVVEEANLLQRYDISDIDALTIELVELLLRPGKLRLNFRETHLNSRERGLGMCLGRP